MKKEWPMCNRAITVSSFLFENKQYTLLKPEIFYVIYFLGTHSTQTATVPVYIYIYIYLFACDFKSENGTSSIEMSPTRARKSAAEVSLMPTWPGTQI